MRIIEKNTRIVWQKTVYLLLTLVCLAWVSSSYAQQKDPVSLLQSIADKMLQGLKENQATLKTKPEIVYRLAHHYVVPHAALEEMAKRVVSRDIWNKASAGQRAQFIKEFTTTVIRTYASSLSSYHDQTIQFYPIRGGVNGLPTVEVNSEIVSPHGQSIHVSYRLMHIASVWKIYDMTVEGVGMLESFRAQFADILAQGNMQTLLHRLSGHNAQRNSRW